MAFSVMAELDLLAAACYGLGRGPLAVKQEAASWNTPWRYDPRISNLQLERTTTIPTPSLMVPSLPETWNADLSGTEESGLIGWAADGFPIYGPYIMTMGPFAWSPVTPKRPGISARRGSVPGWRLRWHVQR